MAFNLSAIMDAIAARLETALPTSVRIYAWPAGDASPPAAIVAYPEDPIEYDETFGGGQHHAVFPVFILVGNASERAARDQLSPYVSTGGVASVHDALDGNLGGAVQSASTLDCAITQFTLAGVDYLAARFDLDVLA